jgi:hypothetical protein
VREEFCQQSAPFLSGVGGRRIELREQRLRAQVRGSKFQIARGVELPRPHLLSFCFGHEGG